MNLDFFCLSLSEQPFQTLEKTLKWPGPSFSSEMSSLYVQFSFYVLTVDACIVVLTISGLGSFPFQFRKLTEMCMSPHRGSARRAATASTTATPTSPAPWTRRTSAVSSTTAETSSRGCTCASTNSCDWSQPTIQSALGQSRCSLFPLPKHKFLSPQGPGELLKHHNAVILFAIVGFFYFVFSFLCSFIYGPSWLYFVGLSRDGTLCVCLIFYFQCLYSVHSTKPF